VIRSVAAGGRIETGGAFIPIHRQRIVERISSAAQQRIALIVAPAGYGKSVALTQYLATLTQPFLRYDVRADNDTLLGFARGLADTLNEVAPNLRNALAGAFEKVLDAPSPGAELAAWMHTHIKGHEGLIAIDDLHVAEAEAEVTKFVTTLIERTKGRLRWIIATRSTLDLPVASWLAYGDMNLAVDEIDLRFTAEEAREAARTARVAVRDDELNEILALIDGWPTALAFALRSSVRSSDLHKLEAETRDKIYRYLAEQVFRSLTSEQQRFLLLASFLTEIDLRVLCAAGFDRSETIIEELRHRVAFIYKEDAGRYRCHDLFRDFLQYELRIRGDRAYREAQLSAARAVRDVGHHPLALALFAQGGAIEESTAMIEQHGLDLIEHGHGDAVSRAASLLPKTVQNRNPSVLAIRASAEMIAGRFDSAEHLYKRAISLSEDPTFKASVAIRLLVLLTNQDKDECANLEPMLVSDGLPPDLRAEAIGALASSHALAGRKDLAAPLVHQALELSDYCESEEARMRALQRVGFASFYVGEYDTAKKSSLECVRLAEQFGYFIMAARAYSVLAVTEMTCDEDVAKTLWYTEQNAACAAKGGDRLGRQTALFQMYEIEARRGNVDRMQAIEDDIAAMQTSDTLRLALILPLRALRASWEGRFGDAHRLASGVCDKQVFATVRALRRAECALYLAADDCRAAALRFVDKALEDASAVEVRAPDQARHVEITRLLCALALGLARRTTAAVRLARSVRGSVSDPVIISFEEAVVALCQITRGGPYEERLSQSLKELGRLGYGGYALLIEAAFRRVAAQRRSPPELTPCELAVLKALSDGYSTKHIAQESSRSVHTIHAHIRAAIAKLGCSGRTEALAIARREGILS